MKTIQEDNLHNTANQRPIRFRFLRAFGVTFGILISLGFFHLLGKFFGAEWENSRRPAVYGKNAQKLKRLLLSLQGIPDAVWSVRHVFRWFWVSGLSQRRKYGF